ncbi:MAG: hypothetical protein K0S45_144 [Nitrospira sp.]|jgi:hypothetical protein|nr:hypothetical protein [Nitrospira sp.]
MADQQVRREVRDAKNSEHHACGPRQDGEPSRSGAEGVRVVPAHPEPAETGSYPMSDTLMV